MNPRCEMAGGASPNPPIPPHLLCLIWKSYLVDYRIEPGRHLLGAEKRFVLVRNSPPVLKSAILQFRPLGLRCRIDILQEILLFFLRYEILNEDEAPGQTFDRFHVSALEYHV